jgi:hypothetical protein
MAGLKFNVMRSRPSMAFLERKNVLDKIYLPQAPIGEQAGFSARRILNGPERQFLSLEAQSMMYGLLNSLSVPPSVIESAVQQAVALGSMSGEKIDAQTFEALVHAVVLNPSFKIPYLFASPVPRCTWIC